MSDLMTVNGTPFLQIEGMLKSYGALQALRGVSFDVSEGEICGLIGPNGSGKSTLFDCCTGLQIPDGGKVLVDGINVTDWPTNRIAREARMLRSFQRTVVFGTISAEENLITAGQMFSFGSIGSTFSIGREARRRIAALRSQANDVLDLVGLVPQRDFAAGTLSIGQQKLLQFAMMLMSKPRVLLLDEPLAGVNPVLIERLIEGIRYANREFGVTFVVIEHNVDVVLELCPRIVVLDQGSKLADADPQSIVSDQQVVEAYLGG